MVKQISCRVISSVPFSKGSAETSSAGRLNKDLYESGKIAGETSNPGTIVNSVRDADILSISFGAEFPTGQVFDFYA